MTETKYVMDALSHLSQATFDLTSRIDGGKRAIEHYLEPARADRLERWRLLLVLDDEIASKSTAAKNEPFWPTMRAVITQMLNGTA
jgi:hypothetical protein